MNSTEISGEQNASSSIEEIDLNRLAYIAVVTFGVISLFGDFVYESARSIIPSYLELLAAPAAVVGFAVGLGEFLGYGLRFVFGIVADKKRAYWPLTIAGYLILVVIPLLAWAGNWTLAIVLVVLERLGKAIRSPARDTLISVSTEGWGTGKAFGFHELMDQLGATLGPLSVAAAIYYSMSTGAQKIEQLRFAFKVLAIPYIALVIVLVIGYLKMKEPTNNKLRSFKPKSIKEALGSRFYRYSLSVFLNTAGLFPVALILYLATTIVADLWWMPLLYLLVQFVDALVAPIAGHLYDRMGARILVLPYILSVVPTAFIAAFFIGNVVYFGLVDLSNMAILLVALIVFGFVLGMQESTYRAAVADLTHISKRGTGYGIFNTLYGLGFWISGVVMGVLLDLALAGQTWVMVLGIAYTVLLQFLAIVLLISATRK